MPRPKRIHPDAILFSPAEAATRLGVTVERVQKLIDDGILTVSPFIPDRITRASVDRLALQSPGAEDHQAGRRSVHDGAAHERWPTASLRLR